MRDKDAITNFNNMQKMLEENNNHVDYTALLEGAAKAEAERQNASREAWARKQAENDKHAEQVQSLLNTLAKSVREDKTRQAAPRG